VYKITFYLNANAQTASLVNFIDTHGILTLMKTY